MVQLRCQAVSLGRRSDAPSMLASVFHCAPIAILVLVASGCDPVVSIAGANFPDWLLCASVGAVLAAMCHPLFAAAGLERYLRPLPLFYSALIVMFALIGWVVFFSRA